MREGESSRTAARSPTMRVMLAAVIWHYWLGVALAIGAVGMIVKMVADYFRTVESQRYPKGK
jgi:hypothetical protein